MKPDGQIGVYFVDYGNEALVSPHHVRLLKKEFLKLPVDCHRAKLAGLAPADGQLRQWPEEAGKAQQLDGIFLALLVFFVTWLTTTF